MFESALGRSEAASSRFGTGAILSGVVHALFAALILIVPGKTKAHEEEAPTPVMIDFVAPKELPRGSPEPAQPAAKPAAAPQQKAAPIPIPEKPVPEPETPQPATPAPNSEGPTGNDTAPTAGPPGGGEGGGSGKGSGTGTGNGPPEPAPEYKEINWTSKMERPVLTAGPSHPEYPRNAMLQHREGTVIARCRITIGGAVRDCSILSGDVMLQQAALDALAQQHYSPFMYNGAAVSVWYMFRFTFKLQAN